MEVFVRFCHLLTLLVHQAPKNPCSTLPLVVEILKIGQDFTDLEKYQKHAQLRGHAVFSSFFSH